jgi:anti-anti-sigma regulatory factor
MAIQARDVGASGTVVELRGAFDSAEADRLHALLEEIEPRRPVTIDFRAVRLFHDFAVARLARDLGDGNRRVAVLGLSEHHHRLLRYMAESQPGKA